MPLIDLPERLPPKYDVPDGYADLAGILTVLNDIFDKSDPADLEPGEWARFGNEEQRARLKQAVSMIPYPITSLSFWQDLQDDIRDLGIENPLKGLSIAFVGGRAHGDRGYESTIKSAWPITHGYGTCHFDVVHQYDGSQGNQLTIQNSLKVLEKGLNRVDYVVTGNVINADDCVADDTMLACSNITKAGGRIIHMLNYGEEKDRGIIGDAALQNYAGQRHVRNVPKGAYRPYGNETGTHIMFLDQEREVQHTADDLAQYRASKNEGRPVTQLEQTGAQITPLKTNGPDLSEADKAAMAQMREMADKAFDIAHTAQSEQEIELVEAYNAMCRKHRIDPIPEIRFLDPIIATPGANALPHRNAMVMHGGFLKASPELRHQLAFAAHETGHILTGESHYLKDTEYRCDRLAVQMIGNTQDLAEALQRVDAKQTADFENLLSYIDDEAMVAQYREAQTAARKREEMAYGTLEERCAAINAVDPNDRRELEGYVRSHAALNQPGISA